MSALDLARAAIDVAVAGGVREVVLCPGSRSAPLAYAVLAAERAGHLRLHVRVDERSAGFLALGLAKVSRAPALVITTSGTAVANLHPAVLEAHHGSVPLIVLSADRPAALRGSGANQTTIQPGIFASALRWEADLDADGDAREVGPPIEAAIAAAVGEAASSAQEPPRPGPAHINLCLREPLVPATWPPVDDWPLNRQQSAPRQGVGGRELRGVDPVFPAAEVFVDDWPRTLLIIGDLVDPSTRPAVVQWAAARGLPVVAEPFGDHAGDKTLGEDQADDRSGSDYAGNEALGGDPADDRPGSDHAGNEAHGGHHGDDRPGGGHASDKTLGGDHADDRPGSDHAGNEALGGDHANDPSGSGHADDKALGGNHADGRPGSDHAGNEALGGDHADDRPASNHAGETAPVEHALVPGTRSHEPGVLPHGPLVLTHADWLDDHAPDRVLVAGRVTLARPVMALLRRPGVRVDALTDTPVAPDPAQVVRASFPLAAILSSGLDTDGPHVSQPAPAPSTTFHSTAPLPAPAQPAPAQPAPEPVTSQSTPAKPATDQQTPAQPTTNQPTPAQPATNQPTSTPGQPAGLATAGAGDRRTWAAAWQAAGDRLAAAIEAEPPQWPTGLAVAQTLVAALGTRPGPTHLFVGPSNPVRDLDLGVAEYPPHLTVVAGRGLAGIDGCVSTAVGIALTVGSAYALMGDLTFLHDANGLLIGPHEVRPDLTIVVVNDAGGGIFRLLEPGTEPLAEAFDRLFGTPTATDIAALCRAHGVAYARADTPADLTRLVTTAPDGLRVVEVPIDPRTHRAAHARLRAQAAAAQAGSTPVAGERSVKQ